MQRILFFGDSLTAGYGLYEAHLQSFPALIAQKISKANLPYTVINGGLSGETSFGGLQRIKHYLKQPVDVFVLALGANDLIRGFSSIETHRNLQEIIHVVKLHHPLAKLVMLGMEIPTIISAKINAFNKIFRQLAEENQMSLLPFVLAGVAGNAQLNLADGFHPSAKGYEVIANNVWEISQPLLLKQHQ